LPKIPEVSLINCLVGSPQDTGQSRGVSAKGQNDPDVGAI
jgi:hypothetical protein